MSELNTEVVLEFLESNTEAKEALISTLKEKDGLSIYNSDEVETWKKNLEDDAFKKTTSEYAKRIEDSIANITGINKEPNEKWHAYQERAFKSTISQLDDLNNKYEEAKGSKDINKDLSDRNTALEQMVNEVKENAQKEIAQILGEKQTFEKKTILNGAFNGLKLKDLGDFKEMFDVYREDQFSKLLSNSKMDNGKLVFLDDDGEVLRNKENLAEPFTAEEILKSKFEKYLDNGVQFTGTGTKESKIQKKESTSDAVGSVLSQSPTSIDQAQRMLKKYYKDNGLGGQSSPNFVKDSKELFNTIK